MKPHQRVLLIGLVVLLAASIAGIVFTRPAAPVVGRAKRKHIRKQDLVDERPLQTARAVAPLVSAWPELRLANRALRLADDEVDLAFATALRDAEFHAPPPSPEMQGLIEHLKQVQARVDADQKEVERWQAAGHKSGADAEQQLDLAQAQLALDQDELGDAQQDLSRAGGDVRSTIKRMLDEHVASHTSGLNQPPVQPQRIQESSTLASHVRVWWMLRDRQNQISAAAAEATAYAAVLAQKHNDLEQRLQQERAGKPVTEATAGGSAPDSDVATTAKIASVRTRAADEKSLSEYDKRVQDQQELAQTYNDWAALVATRQLSSVHGLIESITWILFILLVAFAVNLLIARADAALAPEQRRRRSLHFIARLAIRVIAMLAIVLVVFGAPGQMTTIIGLAGAGLTVALKDFIVAFFGWFVLMGKNGLRVGDWVEINGIGGEVIEIGLLRTVLLETGAWSDSGHPTGRKVAFVNSFAIEGHFFNFSTTGQWLWDQLEILVPPNEDPYPIGKAVQEMVAAKTADNARLAEQEWQRVVSSHALQSFSAAPAMDLKPTNLGVVVIVRYITRAHERHDLRTRLYRDVVEILRKKLPESEAVPRISTASTSV